MLGSESKDSYMRGFFFTRVNKFAKIFYPPEKKTAAEVFASRRCGADSLQKFDPDFRPFVKVFRRDLL